MLFAFSCDECVKAFKGRSNSQGVNCSKCQQTLRESVIPMQAQLGGEGGSILEGYNYDYSNHLDNTDF